MIKRLTESFYDDIRDEIVTTVEHSLDRKGVYASVWDEDSLDDNKFILYVEIENGDWKHQHLFADSVVIDTVIDNYPDMDIEKIDEEVTSDDGSDAYSAIHMFKITNTLYVDEIY